MLEAESEADRSDWVEKLTAHLDTVSDHSRFLLRFLQCFGCPLFDYFPVILTFTVLLELLHWKKSIRSLVLTVPLYRSVILSY